MNGTLLSARAVNQSAAGINSWWQNDAVRGVQITITLLIFLVGVPLNGLVVWALGCRSHRYLARRGSGVETRAANSFRVYVLNLALADLLLLMRTPMMLGYIADNYSWPFGRVFCRVIMFLRCLGLYANAFLLCAVALERCLCLLKPVWSRLRRPTWAVPLTCSIMWLMATILSVPYIYSAFLKDVNGTYQCLESGEFKMGLFVTETVAGFILPLLVFVGSNLAVVITVHKAVAHTPTSTPTTSRRMARMYQVLFLTMLLFLTCWVPYFVFRFLLALAKGSSGWGTLTGRALKGMYVSLFLVYTKSALNPVMYVFAARGLSRAIKASLVSTIERLFSDESLESIRRKSLKNSLKNSQV
ncbi:C3a anaphylatoxin chemotactic receptor isoform X2 [Takifugu rubripes]|uniref:C3a anaphylatoxin chemotactic receptor-like n=2 Tax=Takifugu rubripes TaxID=31033 RepID=H2V4K9_TAKRU|nr:C3a anaphylatoxin chemotactic receptor-like isoform X2 [Takifugu rubripes]XP_029702433.1 C3a anaphylatoxin chemotactic receptor-like isoform X2 [Takifugu rubripes]XP_029702434.1 C3a anaphylatoxin chemotactic receptor-like isoform X2 [Takifugu rubripes]|eukprot:XP_003969953.1 PREDICTED: C3a anaphylatoxin chemotactic receptor-like [Takifugu rubripes]